MSSVLVFSKLCHEPPYSAHFSVKHRLPICMVAKSTALESIVEKKREAKPEEENAIVPTVNETEGENSK